MKKHMLRVLMAALLLAVPFSVAGCKEAPGTTSQESTPDSVTTVADTVSETEAPTVAETASEVTADPTETPADTNPETSPEDTKPADTAEPQTTPAETEPDTRPSDEPWSVPEETMLGLANVALHCPVITNDCADGTNQNLTDGDSKTDYTTNRSNDAARRTFPYEVVVDLTRSYPIKGIRICEGNRMSTFCYDKFTVEVSSDGLTYTQVATHENATAGKNCLEVSFEAEGRFVRITSTDLGEKRSYMLSLSELEVLSEITNYDNILPGKRALVMQPTATDVLTATYRLEGSGSFTFHTSDPSVVTVDELTGVVTAVADGTATLYVDDGTNCTPIPVTVVTPTPAYQISTFYLANHGINSREVFALLKECGINFLENCRPYDSYGNDTTEYLRVQAADYGLILSVADPVNGSAWLSKTDEEIAAIVAQYKNLPGYGGIYILDEPGNANPFARVYNAILGEDPFCRPHLNLLPGGMSDFHGYVSDWVATVGGDNLKSLSYDNYPFGVTAGTFSGVVYNTLNEIRKTGLMYGVETGYYIQAMGIHGAYRVPTDSEILYHTALGVAYGMKDFKWFVWFTPPYSGSGEHFITGILTPEMGKSEIYEGVKAANTMLMTLSPYLATTDAVAVYHTNSDGEKLPSDFCIIRKSGANLVVSLMRDPDTGKQYVVLVNKNMQTAATPLMQINDPALTQLWDLTSGERTPIAIQNSSFTVEIPAGGLCLIELPDGYDARYKYVENDGTSQSLLSGHGASVSSSVGSGTFAYMLNDGNRKGTSWASNDPNADTAWIVFDLKAQKSFNRVDIYPAGDEYAVGVRFPTALSVWVSEDGKTYTKVAERTNINLSDWGAITFDTVTARYVKVSVDGMTSLMNTPCAEIGEIELYMDNGQIPSMETFTVKERTPAANGNLVKGMKPFVSSSYEAWGWTQSVLCDGRTDYVEGVHQGWCSEIGSQTPDNYECIVFPFGTPTTVSKVVVYPVNATFVADYCVEVSTDGVTWTKVAEVAGEKGSIEGPRVLEFAPVEVRYVRFAVTKMWNKSSIYEVGYVVQISEIEVYG